MLERLLEDELNENLIESGMRRKRFMSSSDMKTFYKIKKNAILHLGNLVADELYGEKISSDSIKCGLTSVTPYYSKRFKPLLKKCNVEHEDDIVLLIPYTDYIAYSLGMRLNRDDNLKYKSFGSNFTDNAIMVYYNHVPLIKAKKLRELERKIEKERIRNNPFSIWE